MAQGSKKLWLFLFVLGIILLNVLIFFRARAMQEGGWMQFLWSTSVVFAGGLLLLGIHLMRKQRLQSEQLSFSQPNEGEDELAPEERGEADKEREDPATSRSSSSPVAQGKKRGKKKKGSSSRKRKKKR